MKALKLSQEEKHTLEQIEAWRKVMDIAKGEHKIFAQQQYYAWCNVFFTMDET